MDVACRKKNEKTVQWYRSRGILLPRDPKRHTDVLWPRLARAVEQWDTISPQFKHWGEIQLVLGVIMVQKVREMKQQAKGHEIGVAIANSEAQVRSAMLRRRKFLRMRYMLALLTTTLGCLFVFQKITRKRVTIFTLFGDILCFRRYCRCN